MPRPRYHQEMAELKTKPTSASVDEFLDAIPDESRRKDCRSLLTMMRRVTGEEPRLWGNGVVGFGTYHYVYESGREGDWFVTGFSPRKNDLTLYVMAGLENFKPLLARLGKHKTGKSCLYVKKLDDVDSAALEELVTASVTQMRAK